MLQIIRILQMLFNGSTQREVNRVTGIHRRTIRYYLEQIKFSGKSYEELLKPGHEELYNELTPRGVDRPVSKRR